MKFFRSEQKFISIDGIGHDSVYIPLGDEHTFSGVESVSSIHWSNDG